MHCAAYNCLVSLHIRTQTDPKFYNAFLFKEDSSKNELIFENLVEKQKKYKFQIETETFQDKKTKFVSLRKEFRDAAALSAAGDVNYINSLSSLNTISATNQVSYLNTQNMYESSLGAELSAYDFTGKHLHSLKSPSFVASSLSSASPSGSQKQQYQQISLRQKMANIIYFKDEISNEEDAFSHDANLEIELDELNQNETMCSFVELLQSLVANKITPVYEKGHIPTEMPPWMAFLHKKIQDVYTNENVKLFIVRGLYNVAHVFRSYAKFWYAPLIGFLVNSSLGREEIMDSFTLDLMVLLLSWHKVSLPQASEKKLVNRLFESLIKKCYHDNRAVLKNNLELLKTMTECWRELVDVPVGIINSFLTSNDQKKMATGIQLFGVVLSNNIEHYEYPLDLSSVDFYKNLINCMNENAKTIHASSAEVVGMLMNKLNAKNSETFDSDLFNQVVKFLFEVLSKLDISLFITCVHRIQLNYAAITERFMSKLVFNLPKLYGEFKVMCAESILSSIIAMEDSLFKFPSFMEMLTHRQSSLQFVCLKMIYALLKKQSDEELDRILPVICSFIVHPCTACRYQMILILILVFEKYQFISNSESSLIFHIKTLTNETLLKALLDEDQTIRLMAQNFWTEKANMPSSTIDRMVLILEKMYSPQTENEYLSYSTNLLLEKTSKSPDYNRLVYEQPLSQCTFREYNLTADWRRRHDMMTPLFVETISTLNEQLSQADFKSVNNNHQQTASQAVGNMYLFATVQQSLQFQPTQEMGKLAYNWLTQSSVDTLQASLSSASMSETQSALLFSTGQNKQTAPHQSGSLNDGVKNSDQDILKLRKRFMRDKSVTQNRFFARKQVI